jgi:hypothetical protein
LLVNSFWFLVWDRKGLEAGFQGLENLLLYRFEWRAEIAHCPNTKNQSPKTKNH